MTAPIKPAASSTFGKDNWYFVETIAASTLIPTAVEVNAAGSLDVTDMLFASTGRPDQTTNKVQQERRYGTTKQPEALGITNFTGGDLLYAFNPQGAGASDGKKAFEKFGGTAGTTGYLVNRQGLAKDTTPAAGQFVNVYKVAIGPSFPMQAGDGETGESGMKASVAVTADPAINVALT